MTCIGDHCIIVLLCICHFRIRLTHWGRDKMAAIFQTTFSNGFSWMKMYEFRLKFHWSLFQRAQLTIFQHWFRAYQATSHYLSQWWLIYWRIYAPLGLNELIFALLLQHVSKRLFNTHLQCIYIRVWPLYHGPAQHNIEYTNAVTNVEYRPDLEFTKDTP